MNERRPPVVIGITGNIATGKSTVARMLGQLGAEVIDADRVAHEVLRTGTCAYVEVVRTFGPGILQMSGEIDRNRLGAIVFSNPKAMAQLEIIVHPVTVDRIRRLVAESPAPVIVVEAIKLIESSLVDMCHQVWVTTCPTAQQVARLMDGRGLNRTDANLRISAQSSPDRKLSQADVVIDTGGTLTQTQSRVQQEWRRLQFFLECGLHVEYNGDDAEPCSPARQ